MPVMTLWSRPSRPSSRKCELASGRHRATGRRDGLATLAPTRRMVEAAVRSGPTAGSARRDRCGRAPVEGAVGRSGRRTTRTRRRRRSPWRPSRTRRARGRCHGVGIEEDDLDVEDDEDHGHQVEAHREALGRLACAARCRTRRALLGRWSRRREQLWTRRGSIAPNRTASTNRTRIGRYWPMRQAALAAAYAVACLSVLSRQCRSPGHEEDEQRQRDGEVAPASARAEVTYHDHRDDRGVGVVGRASGGASPGAQALARRPWRTWTITAA